MKKIIILLMLLPYTGTAQTEEYDLWLSEQGNQQSQLKNGSSSTAEVIDECGVEFTVSSVGESNAGNGQGWNSGTGQGNGPNAYNWWYNDLDNNPATGGFDAINYNGITSGVGDVSYSVENDIFYTFCPSTVGDWDITIAPSNCTSSIGGATTNGFQYAIFEGVDGDFGDNLLFGGQNGQNWTNTQTATIPVTAATNCIFIQIDGYAGTQCTFDVSLIGPPGGCILPVELVDFSGQCDKLTWTTKSESNNDYWIIETSIDGASYKEIGTVEGLGNSSLEHNYEHPITQTDIIQYYRITQVDYNGVRETFDPASIYCNESKGEILNIYDMLGRSCGSVYPTKPGIYLIQYSSGKTEKVYLNN